jgi:hypothetical protein
VDARLDQDEILRLRQVGHAAQGGRDDAGLSDDGRRFSVACPLPTTKGITAKSQVEGVYALQVTPLDSGATAPLARHVVPGGKLIVDVGGDPGRKNTCRG